MRKNKGPYSRSYMGTSVPTTIYSEIERLSEESCLRRAQVIRALFLRGLAAYYRDGKVSHDLDMKLVETTNLIALNPSDSATIEAFAFNKTTESLPS